MRQRQPSTRSMIMGFDILAMQLPLHCNCGKQDDNGRA
jgi:hypothetical protein